MNALTNTSLAFFSNRISKLSNKNKQKKKFVMSQNLRVSQSLVDVIRLS